MLSCFHLNDNSISLPCDHVEHDKLHKIHPVLKQRLDATVGRNCREKFNQGCENSVTMVVFKGRSTLKQYCPMKTVRYGYKVWARADSATGYMCDFTVCTGKDDAGRCVDLGAKVLLSP